jgi:class 3 adenylate cyclase
MRSGDCIVNSPPWHRNRAGVHTGEVEFFGDNVRGLAVHEAARVAGVAMPGEVLVSAPTKHMLAGLGLKFESAGNFELKGLGDIRELFCLTESNWPARHSR